MCVKLAIKSNILNGKQGVSKFNSAGTVSFMIPKINRRFLKYSVSNY